MRPPADAAPRTIWMTLDAAPPEEVYLLVRKTGNFSYKVDNIIMSQSIEKELIARMYGHGRGWAFSKIDFAGIGSRESIDTALHRLTRKGTIRRVIRGIYDYPRSGRLIPGQQGPDIQQVARALARKHGWTIEPSGETALNLLGLSTQVPGRYVFSSNGPNRSYAIGTQTLEFRKQTLKDTGARHPKTTLLVNGLKALGKERVNHALIERLREAILPNERPKVLRDIGHVTEWVQRAIRAACDEGSDG